jgi:hypothetical protein
MCRRFFTRSQQDLEKESVVVHDYASMYAERSRRGLVQELPLHLPTSQHVKRPLETMNCQLILDCQLGGSQ